MCIGLAGGRFVLEPEAPETLFPEAFALFAALCERAKSKDSFAMPLADVEELILAGGREV